MSNEVKKKLMKGLVVSDKTDKSIVVLIEYRIAHPRFKKFINRSKKIMAHDSTNKAKAGDLVSIEQSRPFSKKKRHSLAEVLNKAEA